MHLLVQPERAEALSGTSYPDPVRALFVTADPDCENLACLSRQNETGAIAARRVVYAPMLWFPRFVKSGELLLVVSDSLWRGSVEFNLRAHLLDF